jgi:Ca2+-binding RTX toxin-like protein
MTTKYYSGLGLATTGTNSASVSLADANTGGGSAPTTITDTFAFDNANLNASLITGLSLSGSTVSIAITDGAATNTINFSGLLGSSYTTTLSVKTYATGAADLGAIGTGLFSFADGSQLIVGDGLGTTNDGSATATAPNVLLATGHNDTLFGIGSFNTASYVNFNSGVSVSLAAQATSATALTSQVITLDGIANTLFDIQNLTGSKYGDLLTGDANANVINGGGGFDTLVGGGGKDTFYVTNADTVSESGTSTGSTVISSTDYSILGDAGIFNLTLTGTAMNAVGNTLANLITGDTSNNILNGGVAGGPDTFVGGGGVDTYVVYNATDVIQNSATAGTVLAYANYNLATQTSQAGFVSTSAIGTIRLEGTANKATASDSYTNGSTTTTYGTVMYGDNIGNTLIGGTGADSISDAGMSGNNLLIGGSGLDTLIGGLGNDTLIDTAATAANDAARFTPNTTYTDNMQGGLGNNTYYVNNSGDTIIQAAVVGTGGIANTGHKYTNTVYTTVKYTLNSINAIGIDKLIAHDITGSGTAGITVTGSTGNNVISVDTSGAANNILVGGGGSDTFNGGSGNDTFYDDLTTLATINTLASTMHGGGSGLNVFYVTNVNDTITNTAIGNTIYGNYTSGTYLLAGTNVTTIILQGSAKINATGNSSGDIITGNGAGNILTGGAGNDTITDANGANVLTGGGGIDTIVGASGNDTFYDNTSTLTTQTTGSSTMTAGYINATTLKVAGGGTDIFYVTNTSTVVNDNVLGITGTTIKSTVNVALNDGSQTSLTGTAGIYNVTLLAGGTSGAETTVTGNSQNNIIIDQDTFGGQILVGGAGSDTITAGSGTTSLYGNVVDFVNTTTGFVSTTLNGATKAAAHLDTVGNTLIGGAGSDTFYVTNVNDIINDTNSVAGNSVFSAVNFSLNTAKSTGIFNITLETYTGDSAATTATGNGLANVITGNDQNDILIGSGGADVFNGSTAGTTTFYDNTTVLTQSNTFGSTMNGGFGANTYYVTNSNDIINGNTTSGADTLHQTVNSSANLTGTTLSSTSGINIINLIGSNALSVDTSALVTSSSSTTAIHITGNAGTDVLTAGYGNVTIDDGKAGGLVGTATMSAGTVGSTAGSGNDTFIVHNTNDTVSATSTGTNVVQAWTSFTVLSTGIHELDLMGSASINGYVSNGLNDVLRANSGVDLLKGGAGKDSFYNGAGTDTLTGGGGNDSFVFGASAGKNYSTQATFNSITDFSSANEFASSGYKDVIDLSAFGSKFASNGGAANVTLTFDTTALANGSATMTQNHVDFYVSGSNTFVVASLSAGETAATADFKLELVGYNAGAFALAAADFKL